MAAKSLCSITACGKPHYAKGYCRNHSYRHRMHGDPTAGKAAQGEPLAWIRAHALHVGDECLKWPFARFPNGYGVVHYEDQTMHASRVMCIEAHGEPSPDTPFSLHSCGNGKNGCVHPEHLRWGTQEENMADSVADGTRCRGEEQHHSKLTENDVRQIRELKGHAKQNDIAALFGVDPETVRRVQKREAWAWLE
jgi:hypothetical protein